MNTHSNLELRNHAHSVSVICMKQDDQRRTKMQKIAMQSNQALQWRQPHLFKMEYELHAGDELVATLRFRSSFGTLATAQSADGCWTFKRAGFFQ